jgi:hypothetical protein
MFQAGFGLDVTSAMDVAGDRDWPVQGGNDVSGSDVSSGVNSDNDDNSDVSIAVSKLLQTLHALRCLEAAMPTRVGGGGPYRIHPLVQAAGRALS